MKQSNVPQITGWIHGNYDTNPVTYSYGDRVAGINKQNLTEEDVIQFAANQIKVDPSLLISGPTELIQKINYITEQGE